jgi:hypothetical protein
MARRMAAAKLGQLSHQSGQAVPSLKWRPRLVEV